MSGWHAAADVLRAPYMAAFLAGRTVAATGIWLERIGLAWIVWEMTGSASWVGVLAFVRLAPTAIFGPWGGVLADRIGSIGVLIFAYLGAALVSLAVAVLLVLGWLGLAAILVLAGISGSLQALANGPMKAAISEVSPRHLLATAVPLGSVTFNLASFIGPAIAGIVLAMAGPTPVFIGAAATAAMFGIVLLRTPRQQMAATGHGPALAAFADAIAEARSDPVIAPLLALHVVFAILMRPVIDLLPVVVGELVDGGPGALGFLTGAMGLGALAGSLWLTWRSDDDRLRRRVLLGAGTAAVAAALLAFATTEWQAAACLLLFGAALVVRGAGGNTLVQMVVEDSYRGRVMSIWGMVLRLGAAIGGLGLGIAADMFGLRPVLLVAAALALASVLPVTRALRRA